MEERIIVLILSYVEYNLHALIDSLMNSSRVGSLHLYYYFNNQHSKYYMREELQKYVEEYKWSPVPDIVVLTVFTILFALILLYTLWRRYIKCNPTKCFEWRRNKSAVGTLEEVESSTKGVIV